MDSYKKLFTLLSEVVPEETLPEAIARRIQTIVRTRLIVRVCAFGGGVIVSFGALIPVASMLLQKLSTTGFYEYLTLALSGDSAVFLFWKELLWSLVETLPLVSLVAVLTIMLALLWSLTQTFSTARRLLTT